MNTMGSLENGIPEPLLSTIRSLSAHIDKKFVEGNSAASIGIIARLMESLIKENYEKAGSSAFNALALALTAKSYEVYN